MENIFKFDSAEEIYYEHMVLINKLIDKQQKISVDIGSHHATNIRTSQCEDGITAVFCNNSDIINVITVYKNNNNTVVLY